MLGGYLQASLYIYLGLAFFLTFKIEKEIRNLYDGKSKFNLTLDKGNVVTKKVENMTEEEVKKAKKSIASEATRLSKEQLFGKEKKTREEKMEDKRLSRARKRFD